MINAADVTAAVHLSVDTLAAQNVDWDDNAHELDWTRWETIEHLANTLFSYGSRFTLRTPPADSPVAYDFRERREDGPANLICADPAQGGQGLLQVLEACGGILAATLTTAAPDTVCYHVYGSSNPAGFAAMAVTETLVHTYDVFPAFVGPEDLCDKALRRIFPEVPTDTERWPALLWATGRGELEGHERRITWQWRG